MHTYPLIGATSAPIHVRWQAGHVKLNKDNNNQKLTQQEFK